MYEFVKDRTGRFFLYVNGSQFIPDTGRYCVIFKRNDNYWVYHLGTKGYCSDDVPNGTAADDKQYWRDMSNGVKTLEIAKQRLIKLFERVVGKPVEENPFTKDWE